ncbi:TRAP transporter small permease [Castellaniella caeni]|uniref:TRAP transporter small permease n=1 Tax=Castellaniella caeni TaxID=266123 RepID=UPI00082D7D08|nr:TRAP transporter small permease [Castellaniella caeni]
MLGNILRRLSVGFALIGGMAVLAIVAMSIVSLVGRKLFSAPIPGDIELLEMVVAVAVAAFLPLCEIGDNHIRVDLLAGIFPEAVNRFLLTLCHLSLAVVSAFICWRTGLLTLESYHNMETSTMLMVPLWIPQGLMLPSFALLTLCGLYRAGLAAEGIAVPHEIDTGDEVIDGQH